VTLRTDLLAFDSKMLRYGETGRVWLGRWDSRVAVHEMRETSMEMTKQKRKGFGIDSGSLDLDTSHGTHGKYPWTVGKLDVTLSWGGCTRLTNGVTEEAGGEESITRHRY
jgi:hypothetical protein